MSVSAIARNNLIETGNPVKTRRNLREIAHQEARLYPTFITLKKVEDLIVNRPFRRIDLLVLNRYPPRTVMSKGWTGSIAAACGGDETGQIGLVLWGDQVDRVRTGDIISIQDGWCQYSHGKMVVSTGRTGKLTILEA